MIGFLPDPLPDELLYSVAARYHERTGYRSMECTSRDLFGIARAAVAVDLPCHIDALVSVLPPGHVHSADRFIDQNSLLPLYAPFTPPERVSLLREDMRGASGGSVHGRLGVLTSDISLEFLRYCPACVEADRRKFGETYWRRLHQAPGAEACPAHKVFLENSHVRARGRSSAEAFVTAEQAAAAVAPRRLDESDPTHRPYLRIAEDVRWLLAHPGLERDQASSRAHYVALLGNAGFLAADGRVKTTNLINAMCDYYTPEFLESIGCGPGGREYYWIRRLVHNHGKSQHPLQHLLLMQFLGCSAADFFLLPPPQARHPFGEGPWPCLNRAADHFGEPTITECEVSRYYMLKRPRGKFMCECGFAYSRVGPDLTEDARYVIGTRLTCGKVWEDKFKEMYREGQSRKKIAAALGVSAGFVKVQAARLGLLLASEGDEAVGSGQEARTALRDKHRQAWLEARKTYPEAGRSALSAKLLTASNWLRNNDREWLEENFPARVRRKGPPIRVDWAKRDVEFAEAARREARRLKNEPGRPIRVTVTGVAKAIGCLAVTSKRGELLPLTVKTLDDVSESVEEAAIRRVEWAARCFRAEGIRPNKWELLTRAGMSAHVASRPPVAAAINAALLSIEPSERATAIIPVAA